MPTQNPLTAAGAHVHIIGIAGAGMSAVARVLLDSGITVSGSDRQINDVARALQHDGATIYEGHDTVHIAGATIVLISSAVKDDNPELAAAKAASLPILDRRAAFPYLLPDKVQIAVAGTNGKTTTTALIVHLLRETGHDPSYIVGGVMGNTGDNAHAGKGEAFVVEADEYGGMYLGLSPKIAVITNIEHDHPDIFPTLNDVIDSFREFLSRLSADATLIACANNDSALSLAHERKAARHPVLIYGLNQREADWQANHDSADGPSGSSFLMNTFREGQAVSRRVTTPLVGDHNILNALAAIAAVHTLGVALDEILPALATFKGTGRRFELLGQAHGVSIISDYAHHPTAIRATLQAARQRYGKAPIWAVWQPHTYSRTRVLAADFASAFGAADHTLITDIYAAREVPQPGDLTAADLAGMVSKTGHADARYSGTLDTTAEVLRRETRPGDVVIILSAGDAPRIGEMLLNNPMNNRA